MDKIEKALRKLNTGERSVIGQILKLLSSGKLAGLDIKKLKGRDDIFRVRKGDMRIIYRVQNGDIYILIIVRRGESTYKF